MLYKLENNNEDIYKKVINMIPTDVKISINVDEFNKHFGDYTINRTKTIAYEINNEPNNKTRIYEQKGGAKNINNIKNISFMVNTNVNNEKELENSWWFKYYFQIPYCAYGRLTQSTGTCWCNTIINSLVLNPSIVNLLIEKFNKLESKTKVHINKNIRTFDTFNNSNENLTTLLFAMINILLIKKVKAKQKNGNFIAELAARIKGISNNNDEFYYSNHCGINYGDGGDTAKGVQIVLNKLFSENEYIIINYQYTKSNELLDKLNQLINKKNQLINKLNQLINKKIQKEIDNMIEEIDKIQKEIDNIRIKRNKIINKPTLDDVGEIFYKLGENIINFQQIDKGVQIDINGIKLPKFIIITYERTALQTTALYNVQSNAPDKIILNNTD